MLATKKQDEKYLGLAERLYRSAVRHLEPWAWIPKQLKWTDREKAKWIKIAKLAEHARYGTGRTPC